MKRICYWMKGRTYEEMYGSVKAAVLRRLRSTDRKGKISALKGKTYEEIHGVAKARVLKRSRSRSTTAYRKLATPAQRKIRLRRFRASLTPEVREKIGSTHRGVKRSAKTRARIAKARAERKFPFNKTKPEIMVASFLRFVKVRYRSQYRPKGLRTHAFDFRLKDFKILVEVDGCYWHGCPDHYPDLQASRGSRDGFVTKQAQLLGWTMVRLWEHEILAGKFNKIFWAIRHLEEKEDVDGKSAAA